MPEAKVESWESPASKGGVIPPKPGVWGKKKPRAIILLTAPKAQHIGPSALDIEHLSQACVCHDSHEIPSHFAGAIILGDNKTL